MHELHTKWSAWSERVSRSKSPFWPFAIWFLQSTPKARRAPRCLHPNSRRARHQAQVNCIWRMRSHPADASTTSVTNGQHDVFSGLSLMIRWRSWRRVELSWVALSSRFPSFPVNFPPFDLFISKFIARIYRSFFVFARSFLFFFSVGLNLILALAVAIVYFKYFTLVHVNCAHTKNFHMI